MYKTFIAATLLLFLGAGCKKAEEVVCPACSKDIVCSTEYRYYTVRVMNSDGAPVALDRFETIAPNGKALSRNITQEEITLGQTTGYYPLVDDRQRNELNTCEREYEFRGYAGADRLVARKFKLRDDCCHVELVSGNQFIVYP